MTRSRVNWIWSNDRVEFRLKNLKQVVWVIEVSNFDLVNELIG